MATDEMMRAWQTIRGKANFGLKPVWSAVPPPDLTQPIIVSDGRPPVPSLAYDFRILCLEDHGKVIGRGIFGRQHGDDGDWLPVEQMSA